ncbi:MAG TPA: DNA polymerase/3'-5' exonuclease PolX [bacterium]
MKQHELADLFEQTADLLEFRGENPFRVRAYRRAARSLEGLGGDLAGLGEEEIRAIPGIGADLAGKIAEFTSTGKVKTLEALRRGVPPGVLDLLGVPGLGPKTVKLLHEKLRIDSPSKLEEAARAGRLRGLPGIQAKKEARILKGLEMAGRAGERMHLGLALPMALEMVRFLQGVKAVSRVSFAGSLRRMCETIGDVDLLAASRRPGRVMEAFLGSAFASRTLAAGPTKSSIVTKAGIQVDLRVVAPDSFGAALQYFTGSKEHNVRLRERAARQGKKVNEYGVFASGTNTRLAGREEEDVYKALGLAWIPPELREDHGEIELAMRRRLPELVEAKDVAGDFHVHTAWSDGRDSLEAMAEGGRARGYAYMAICDHSRSLTVAHGLSVDRLRSQRKDIDAWNRRKRGPVLLQGGEVDVLADGSMDYPDDVLAELDVVIASIHTGFTQPRERLTERLIRAAEHPAVTILGHPTGRLLGQRDAYDVDLEAVLRAAKRTGTAIEINGSPTRLDLSDGWARRARELGVTLVLSTDSHSVDQLGHIDFALGVARRAGVPPSGLLNCRRLNALRSWIAKKRR